MRLTTGARGDGDVLGLTMRSTQHTDAVEGSARAASVRVHVVPLETWWAGLMETLCSRQIATVVGWHDPGDPDPRLCTVCTKRVAQLRTDRQAVAA